MDMNRTQEFRDVLVKAKDAGVDESAANKAALREKLLPSRAKQSRHEQLQEFATAIRELVRTISKMRKFLLDNRRDYINL